MGDALCPRCGARYDFTGHAQDTTLLCLTCGAEVPPPPALPPELVPAAPPPSDAFGKYRILREVARGGMGIVYEAEDPTLRRRVALKVLADDQDPAQVRRLHREAAVAARLTHPGIIVVHEVGAARPAPEAKPVHYIAMDFVDGDTLDRVMERLTLAERVRILGEVAEAVGHAHDAGVIHRDLKPPNILLRRDGRAIVTDFGLARAESDQTRLTRTGAVMGTVFYMAPEQARGRTREIGPRTDVWALGVILYEMLAGRRPFRGDTPAAVYEAILNLEPDPPRRAGKSVPSDLETICLKALEKEPARRYATARTLAADLRRWRSGEPIEARPASRLYRLRKRLMRNPWTFVAVAAATLFLLAGIAVTAAWRSREHAHELSAEGRRAVDAARAAVREWEQQRYGKPHDVSPSRRRLREAVPLLERALALQPDAHPLWCALGKVRLELGQAGAAREALQKAAQLQPAEGSYRFELGRAFLAIYARDQAVALAVFAGARAVRAREAADAWAQRALEAFEAALSAPRWEQGAPWQRDYVDAYVRWKRGDADTARDLCRRIAQQHALGGEEALLLLGQIVTAWPDKTAAFEQAADQARSYAAAYAAAAEAHSYMARALTLGAGAHEAEIQEHLRKVLELAGQAITIDPESPDGWTARSRAHHTMAVRARGQGDDPEPLCRRAVEDAEEAVRLDPGSAHSRLLLGTARQLAGAMRIDAGLDPTELLTRAIDEDFAEAIRLDPSLLMARVNRAAALGGLGLHRSRLGEDPTALFQRAIDDCVEARSSDSPDACRIEAGAWANWGSYRQRRGENPSMQYERAAECFAQAVRLEPGDSQNWRDSALLWATWGQFRLHAGEDPADALRRAIEQYTRAVALSPQVLASRSARGSVRVLLAEWLRRNGADPTELLRAAIEEDFDVLVRVAPSNGAVWTHRANASLCWAEHLTRQGQDGRARFRRAVDDFEEALRRGVPEADVAPGLQRARAGLER